MKVKCIKSVVMQPTLDEEFTVGKFYEVTRFGDAINNSGRQHSIGLNGGEWFDKHFICPSELYTLKGV